MAESTLNDVVKKLEEVKSAVTAGDSTSATQQAKAAERASEAKQVEDEKIGIFQDIADKLNLFKGMKRPKDEGGSSLFGKIMGKLGVVGLATTLMSGISSALTAAFVGLKSSFAGAIMTKLASLVGPVAIITGLALAIKDGLIGWTKSEDWGVSKISGFLGGFFGGDADGGIKNAFAKAGQFALIGAGIGSVVPVVGTIAGGLIGAAIGGILGFIGGRKLAEGFDGIGTWFKEKFDNLILAPIKAVWDTIAPDWVKSIDFKWSDLFPPALTKLFGGKYFTVDFPAFSWTDLFPQFLVDLFNNVAIAGKETTFEWKDLLPEFFIKFFKGEYSKEGSFSWRDLVPGFILKVIDVAKTAWADTDFTYKSLLPGFITKLIEGTEFTPTGTFSWKDLVPEFIWKLTTAGAKAAKTEEGFKWSNLLPDWMIGAWDSTKGLIKQSYFGFKNLLPEWMQPYITTAEGEVASALKTVGSWNWKSLLPKFIVDFIDDPTQITKEDYSFSWESLVPPFVLKALEMGKNLGGGLVEGAENLAGKATDKFLSLINMQGTEHDGGLIKKTGKYQLRQGEMVMTPAQMINLQKGLGLLTNSQALEQAGRGGAPVVVNNINNSQSNPVISNQSTTMKVPDSVRSADPTFALARQSFSY